MSDSIPLVIHATHEAAAKVGGIGSVLEGILSSAAYNRRVERTILVGPMFGWDAVQMERLNSRAGGVRILYSSIHGIHYGVDGAKQQALRAVEQAFQVALLYGVRRFGQADHEILLVDATRPDLEQIARFCYFLWEHYGIESRRYNHDNEYNLYVSIAQPLFEGLKGLSVDEGVAPNERLIIAHDWLGLPVAFAAQLNEPEKWRTAFYVHEMATARLLVESHSGHDTRFYNTMLRAKESHLPLDTLFGDQTGFFKHALLRRAVYCDAIFAVSDLVREELRFLGGHFVNAQIDLVYNGIRSEEIALTDRLASKRRLQLYCRALLGFEPDYVFTHVARLVLSKAMWRDVRVMAHIDGLLREAGETAALFILATSHPAGRQSASVREWEAEYGWPVGHRADNGDLVAEEAPFFFSAVEPYNHAAHSSQIVLVNQFGWSRELCGKRMPAAMTFADIRRGSDLEFGLSIYEPFGISQVEPVNGGAIACVSSVCGCVGFLMQAAAELLGQAPPEEEERALEPSGRDQGVGWRTPAVSASSPLVVADYVSLPESEPAISAQEALTIDRTLRDRIEECSSREAARRIFARLPRTRERMAEQIRFGSALAQRMSWERVVEGRLLPALARATSG